MRRLRLREAQQLVLSAQPAPSSSGMGTSVFQSPLHPHQVCALNQQAADNCGVNAVSYDSQLPLGHRASREEACLSPSALSPHSRSTQPELLSVAGAYEMALTSQELSEGPACGCLQNPEPHPTPYLQKGSCPRTAGSHSMNGPRTPTPSCQHLRSLLRS